MAGPSNRHSVTLHLRLFFALVCLFNCPSNESLEKMEIEVEELWCDARATF